MRPDLIHQLRSARRPRSFSEVQRIVNLPTVVPPEDPEGLIDRVSRENVQAHAYDRGFRLRLIQCLGVDGYDHFDGLFGSIAVGFGKTYLSMLIAQHAFKKGIERIMLLIPGTVHAQLTKTQIPWARMNLVVNLPIQSFYRWGSNKPHTGPSRLDLAQTRAPGLYILPYSLLSTKDSLKLLNGVAPGLIIADEAQELRTKGKSAKVKRFMTYVDTHRPEGVCMSGTLSKKSPLDYHHLIRWCLGQNSPLPIPVANAILWAQTLGAGADKPSREARREFRPLLEWAGESTASKEITTESLRRAYRKRLYSAPGFVTTGDDTLGVGLTIQNIPAVDPGPALLKLIKQIDDEWKAPDGTELSHATEIYSVMRQLSMGFYYRREGGTPEHREIHAAFQRELRAFFSSSRHSKDGLDTPGLVKAYMARQGSAWGKVPAKLYQAWKRWDALPPSTQYATPVWVDEFKVAAVLDWARKKPGGIVWVHHQEVGQRVYEALHGAGQPTLHKAAGAEWGYQDGSERFFCVASIGSHHRGLNLQHHENQLVLEWPRPADMAEQLLGRCHRWGQEADHLIVNTVNTLDWDHQQMAATLTDAVYVRQTLGDQQKLLYCNWDPLPTLYDESFLQEHGFEVKHLDEGARRLRQEVFGS